MKISKKILLGTVCSYLLMTSAFADTFFVRSIRVEGLKRVSRQTVLNYVPVHEGQTIDSSETTEIINALYQTGFFSNVEVERNDDVLLIRVRERPVIGKINISGNHDIEKDKLETVLKNVGLAEGRVLDSATLDRVRKSLQNEYYNRGKFNAVVTTTVTPKERGRVEVDIDVSEGAYTIVRQINIIGNHAFSQWTLKNQMDLSTPSLITYLTGSHHYSQQAFSKSLDKLRKYYLDHGYLHVEIESTSASITPDRSEVYVTLRIHEGPQYFIKGYRLSGRLILPEEKLREFILIQPGEPYSQRLVKASSKALGHALGNEGYLFAMTDAIPEVNDKTHEVFLTFVVEPNQRVYVRRIYFSGNLRTSDISLRHKIQQNEGSLASIENIRESERRLRMLGYLKNVKAKTVPVVEHPEQVDIEYELEEAPSAGASVGVGYGTNGLYVNASLNQTNFLGTGKFVGATFQRTNFDQNITLAYSDPDFTVNGIELGFNIFDTEYTPHKLNIADYTFNTFGGNVTWSIPISILDDRIQMSLGYQFTHLVVGDSPSMELRRFVTNGGHCSDQCRTKFNQGVMNISWSRSYLDRAIFPTRGLSQIASLQVAASIWGEPLDYYKLSYNIHWFQPIWRDFIFAANGAFGYGGGFGSTSSLPFFHNYFAGGIGVNGAVRGYGSNTLGPVDSNGRPLGGNFLTAGSMAIIFPNFIAPERLRTSVFIDAGNVYNTHLLHEPPYYTNQHAGPIRFSTGLGIEWRVPILEGIFSFSLATPLNAQPARRSKPGFVGISGDDKQWFQFTLGTSF